MKCTTSVKKTRYRSNQKQQLETSENSYKKEEEKRIEVEAKYKDLQKIHECTKKDKKISETEIPKLKHEKDTAEEVMKALRNANFNKIQINTKYKIQSVQRQIKNKKYRNLIQ